MRELRNDKKISGLILMVCSIVAQPSFAAVVTASYNIESIIHTYVDPGAVDIYGAAIENLASSNVSVSFSYDNDAANATSSSVNYPDYNYEFHGPAYNASLFADGALVASTTWSAITVANNIMSAPDGGIPQYLIDAGVPSSVDFPVDVIWMGGYSEDYTHWPQRNGLVFSIDFVDMAGDWLQVDGAIPPLAPDLGAVDLALFQMRQYENDVLQFEVVGIVVNNVSAVPVPAAVWLFGSGLIGVFGVARCSDLLGLRRLANNDRHMS